MIMGIFQSIYSLGMFLGPVVAGRIGAILGPRGLFLSTSFVGLVAILGVVAGRHLLRPTITYSKNFS
jgi:MFS family permease